MKFRKSLLAAMCLASLGAVSVPTTASADVAIYLNTAPPPPRYEPVPAPRHGYTWSSGYWNVKGQRHEWQAGHWEKDRTGYQLAQPTWTQHDNRWQLERAHWNKGQHDGAPNAVEHAPDNDHRH